MGWTVLFHPDFASEAKDLAEIVQDEMASLVRLLQANGPHLRRPHCGTLNGSRHPNMKELRFDADDGVWRIAFAFDASRQAILLVGGDKSGVSQTKFYRALIRKADRRFDEWLEI